MGCTASPVRSPPWQPDPVRQRLANYTIEDVLELAEPFPVKLPNVRADTGVVPKGTVP